MANQPKRQTQPVSVPIQAKQVWLQSPEKVAEAIASELEALPVVNFSFMQESLESPYSLPHQVGQLLYQEELVDINGRRNFFKLKKLKDPNYIKLLKAKIIFIINQNWLKNIFYQGLVNNLTTLETGKLLEPDEFELLVDFLASRYSVKTSMLLLSLGYSQLLGPKNPVVKSLNQINLQVQNAMKLFLKQDKKLIEEIILQIKVLKKTDLQPNQQKWLNQTLDQIDNTINNLVNFPSYLNININPQTFPTVTFSETMRVDG